jgi:outer membrane protein TolC
MTYRRTSFAGLFAGLFALYLPMTSAAPPTNNTWEYWFKNQINHHPDILSAKQQLNASLSQADDRGKPLYNPELQTDYETYNSFNNFTIGISQTVDWFDKRGTRITQANYNRAESQVIYEFLVQQKAATALQTLSEWRADKQRADLARQQESQLETLLELISERQKTGDLGQIDAELAFLNLSQRLSDTATALAKLKQTEAALKELLPDWSGDTTVIPDKFWLVNGPQARQDISSAQWVEKYPSVKAAWLKWQGLQEASKLASLDAKAEPNVGLKAGINEKQTLVGLTLSLPLNFRNNFSARIRASNQRALSAEAAYRSVRRTQLLELKSSSAVLQEFKQRYERWQQLMKGRDQRTEILLGKLWRSGDMSTMDYMLALQQRAEGLAAGIQLNRQFQHAQINQLFQSGYLSIAPN